MSKRIVGGAVFLLGLFSLVGGQEPKQPDSAELAKMMERMKKFTTPAKSHQLLERFVGEWDTETRIFMGGRATPAEKGTARIDWLMKGRWLRSQLKGRMMGRPIESFSLMGYDNFKMSYVVSSVSSMDTAMNTAEGDMDPGGKTMLLYGTVDEYLTGEHDKMVKTVWRFESADKMVMEIHDLPIGEKNTKVVEVTYTRKKK